MPEYSTPESKSTEERLGPFMFDMLEVRNEDQLIIRGPY